MISTSVIIAARAVPMPALVARDRPLKRSGRVWFALCPAHSERTPSLAVYDTHAYCFGCSRRFDQIDWLRATKGLDFATAVRELAAAPAILARIPGDDRRAGPPVQGRSIPELGQHPFGENATTRYVANLWSTANRPDIARVYLRSRRLPCEALSEAIRGHPAIWCKEAGEPRPCVLAAVEEPERGIVALQRIWTRECYYASEGEDARPQDLQCRKKSLGTLGTGAVRLAPAGPYLGLAEGVETALAAAKLYRRPVWATLGSARYGHPAAWIEQPNGARYRSPDRAPTIWIPPGVVDLVIFGDRDGGVGEESAIWAAAWWAGQGIGARAIFPPSGKKDFAECL